MTLGQLQRQFAQAYAQLILHASEIGYEVSLGDSYRDPRVFGAHGSKKAGIYGRKRSLHKLRLAADLNLFRDGEYLQLTEDHAELGMWWETEYREFGASWGGRFNDGNHYSFAYRDMR